MTSEGIEDQDMATGGSSPDGISREFHACDTSRSIVAVLGYCFGGGDIQGMQNGRAINAVVFLYTRDIPFTEN